jgi:hypothetical protein
MIFGCRRFRTSNAFDARFGPDDNGNGVYREQFETLATIQAPPSGLPLDHLGKAVLYCLTKTL